MKHSHPKGLYVLFFAEMWERFSFYGMRSLLVLYMTKQLFYSDTNAYGVYGAYGALVYGLPMIGGILADRLLGYQRAILIGGSLMAVGHFCMAIPSKPFFYGALALICLGNGFFKPNISSIVGKLYQENDTRRDAGFTLFYMGINIGAFLAPLVCGTIGELYGWHFGFGLAGVGMVLGLITFVKCRNLLEGKGLPPSPEKLQKRQPAVITATFLAIPLVAFGLARNEYLGSALYVTAAVVIFLLLWLAFKCDKAGRERLFVVMVLFVFQMTFWAFFEQAGSSLTLFADRNVERHLFGFHVQASQFQAINPLFIIALAPFFAGMWHRLQEKNKDISIPTKFVLGLIQVGLGFACLVIGAYFARTSGLTAAVWLALAYLFHTTGELCISPIGLSAVTKLAPAQAVGTVMGSWFLTLSFAHYIGGGIAKLTGTQIAESTGGLNLNLIESLGVYSFVFKQIVYVSLGAALLLIVLTPMLKRWMHGVK